MTLALYDLDHTLLAGDCEHAWGEFLVDAGVLDAEDLRAENERLRRDYLKGTLDIYESVGFQLRPLVEHPPDELRRWRGEFVEEHRDAGDDLAIITACNSFLSEPIAERFDIPTLLAVELQHHEHRYTGRVLGTPTFREGKVKRVVEWTRETGSTLDCSYFYADSHNDLSLLELVDNPVAVDPDPVLSAHAEARNWPIRRLHGCG